MCNIITVNRQFVSSLCVSKADESGTYQISFLILCLFKVIFYFLPW